MIDIPEFPDKTITRTITCDDTGVQYAIIDRNDIQVEAPSYFFRFSREDSPKNVEYSDLIIAHATVEEAIDWFAAKHFRYDAYANARFTIERIGIDFEPYREVPLVIGH